MKKLALVTDAWEPQVNGVVTTLKKMVEHAESQGWVVTVIHPGLPLFKTIATPGYPEIRTVVNPWRITKLLSGFDSIHVATEGSLGIAARVVVFRRGWYCTSGYHTNFPEYLERRTRIPAAVFYPVFRWLHSRNSAVYVPSTSTRDKLVNKGFKNVVVWGRGYDELIFNPDCLAVPQSLPIKVLYVGRVAVEKNLGALLELQNYGRYEITIVGDGPDRQSLQALYPHARFVGYRRGRELARYYKDADVFAFPSRTDTFGLVMLESMACGTAVAAYPVEGPNDVVIDGKGGILREDLAEAIELAALLKCNTSVIDNAKLHSWSNSASTFFDNLVDLRGCRFG